MPRQDLRAQRTLRTGQDLVKHLETFSLDLKFSAGVWFFAPAGGRFHDRYIDPMSVEQRLEIPSACRSTAWPPSRPTTPMRSTRTTSTSTARCSRTPACAS